MYADRVLVYTNWRPQFFFLSHSLPLIPFLPFLPSTLFISISMFFRKPSPTVPLDSLPSCTTTTKSENFSKSKDKDPQVSSYNNTPHNPTFSSSIITNNKLRSTLFSCLFFASWFLVLHFWFPPTTSTITTQHKLHIKTCITSAPFYIYNLPQQFNLGLLEHCQKLNIYTNMCPHVANNGLGQPLSTPLSSSSSSSWFATHQFIAEMIIHARLENHACRTWDPSKALLFYVPFYGGLYASSVFREPNHTRRDSLAVDLVDLLMIQPWWKRHNGKDHFLALGRTAWDFMRTQGGDDFGANILLNLPPVKNMSVLTVERHPWKGTNQFGIPYPSYFHPTTPTELITWQNRMRESKRPYLFSFVGGKRKGLEKAKVRDQIVRQCEDSERCELVQCGSGASRCHDPTVVIDVMRKSRFCLQAPGDSFTRRSTFDSILAGCVPVFFSPHTAYTQYPWYLPSEREKFSVFIDEKECGEGKKRIEEVLLEITSEQEERMRELVIRLIPKVTYVYPNASDDFRLRDVVDVALERLSLLVDEKIHDQRSTSKEII